MNITKLGFYRSKAGDKFEIVSIRGNFAIGWTVSSQTTPAPMVWNAISGRQHIDSGCVSDVYDLVSEWSDQAPNAKDD